MVVFSGAQKERVVKNRNDWAKSRFKLTVYCEKKPESRGLLTTDGAVFDAKQLGLVVASDCGVTVHVSWKHWQGAGQVVRSSHPFFF